MTHDVEYLCVTIDSLFKIIKTGNTNVEFYLFVLIIEKVNEFLNFYLVLNWISRGCVNILSIEFDKWIAIHDSHVYRFKFWKIIKIILMGSNFLFFSFMLSSFYLRILLGNSQESI